MNGIYALGRTLYVKPHLASQPAWREMIEKSAPIIAKYVLRFSTFYLQSTDTLEREWEWGEEWFEVCRDWSSAQFIRELYGDKLNPPFHYFSEIDDYLDDLRAQGQKHGPLRPGDIPEGIPPSHRWWWYPNPPGNAQTS